MREISTTPDSELALLIKEAAASGGHLVVDTGEAAYRVDVTPVAGRPPESRLPELARRLAGSLADVDIPGWESSEAAERWVEDLRKADHYPFDRPTNP
jgi:hypothetical protein